MDREPTELTIDEINAELAAIDAERDRLVKRLAELSDCSKTSPSILSTVAPEPATKPTVADKLAAFRRLFRGRDDVYAVRWTDAKTGKSSYMPACRFKYDDINPQTGKPRRELLPFTDDVLINHLRGSDPSGRRKDKEFVAGIYPMLEDETCWLLAADFDKQTWAQDAIAYAKTCRSYGIDAAVERSRSGNGAHVWIFFAEQIPAALARRPGTFCLTKTMETHPEIGLDSYDRFFPNQDTMSSGGFGNLIALPLQRSARRNGNSVFVDDKLEPYPDQMAFLASVKAAERSQAEAIVEEAQRHGDIVGVRMVTTADEFDDKPWTLPPSQRRPKLSIIGKLPAKIEVVLANQVFVPKADVPPQLLNELIRIAAFQNPEFYKAQAMRFSTFDKPRIVACAENFVKHIALPRGCLDDVTDLLKSLASKAHYVLGLSATPVRRDGHHPIIFMQCGPVRFQIDPRIQAAIRTFDHRVCVRTTSFAVSCDEMPPIQTLYGLLASDADRNALIVPDVADALAAGRSPLVLTERTDHAEALTEVIRAHCPAVFVLRGGMAAKQRRTVGSLPQQSACFTKNVNTTKDSGVNRVKIKFD